MGWKSVESTYGKWAEDALWDRRLCTMRPEHGQRIIFMDLKAVDSTYEKSVGDNL